jgi:uncharacterized membrane protein
LTAAGLDERFLKDMIASLQPDRPALLCLIPRRNLIDERQLLDSLSAYEGTLHKTTFSDQVVSTILESTTSERRQK